MTARHPAPTALLPPQRPGRHGVTRVALVLLGVFALFVAGYSVREALHSDGTSSGAPAGAGLAGIESAPVPPVVSEPVAPEPAQEQRRAEPNDDVEQLLGVLVVPTTYWGENAGDAAITAKSQGLVPRVVDEEGAQVDRDRRSRCRVTSVRPIGFVARGSTLELTCRRVR